MKRELFLQIYTEEIPCEMQKNKSIDEAFIEVFINEATRFGINLLKNQINFDKSCVRSVIWCEIEDILTIKSNEIRGPKIDASQDAIDGFLRKNNIKKENLTQKDGYLLYKTEEKTLKTEEILPEFIKNCFKSWENIWPSVSIWAENFKWPRPVRGLNILFDKKTIDLQISDIKSSDITIGHKFRGKINTQKILSKDDFYEFLSKESITLDKIYPTTQKDRLNIIQNAIKSEQNCELNNMQIEIIEEINTICESVWCITSKIDKKFDVLPDELVISVLKNHLKYVPLIDKNGNLTRKFAIIIDTNEQNIEKEKNILKGNLTVLNARLEDALFFFNKDKSQNIEFFKHKLCEINFDKDLGSLLDLLDRTMFLYAILSSQFGFNLKTEVVNNILDLIKLDLGSSVVSEFPELQGNMVKYYFSNYAKNKDLLEKIAIYQYKTILEAENGNLNTEAWELLLTIWLEYSLSLVSVGKKPTSSKDPFGIRRRLKYVFQAVKILKIKNFEEKLPEVISKYLEKINKKTDAKDVLNEVFKHKND